MDELIKKIDGIIDLQKEIVNDTDNGLQKIPERNRLSGMVIIRKVVTVHMQLLHVRSETNETP